MAALVGVNVRGNTQPFPPSTPMHMNEPTLLVQPSGNVVRSVVTASAVAGRPSSVVNVTAAVGLAWPTIALIWPEGAAIPTTLSLVVAA